MPTTFVDLRTSVMNRVGFPTGDTTLVTRTNLVINQVNRDIALQRPWRDLQRRATFITFTPVTTGNVTVTAASATVAGGSTSPTFTTNAVAAAMRFKGNTDEIYTIRTVPSETSLTLGDLSGTTAWQGATTTNMSYRIWQDEYALASDFREPVNLINFLVHIRVRPIGFREMRELFPWPSTPGRPRYYTLVKPSVATDQRTYRVLLYPPPDDNMIVPYEYITTNMAYTSAGAGQETLSADADEPWMFEQYRHVLVWGALRELYRDYKDDQRSQESSALYADGIRRMANDELVTHDSPRLKPWIRKIRYARGEARYDTRGKFDRLEI